MTHFLQDILRQPEELQRTIAYLRGQGRLSLARAAEAVRGARHVYLTGIGSSWHAALAAGHLFSMASHPVILQDASELLHFAAFPPDAAIIAISRTGRSIEIVQLIEKAREAGAAVIGITNAADGALAREATIPIVIETKFDHGISVNTYSTLAITVSALATTVVGAFDDSLASSLVQSVSAAARCMQAWQEQISKSPWLLPGSVCYFLGRGASLGTGFETRLLWEEGVKSPASAMGTGSFRHGPQEIVTKDTRFGIWLDELRMRDQDFALARDLMQLGASVMLIGQNVPADAGNLVLRLPQIPGDWQFLIDIFPAQLVSERMASLSDVDCDSFRLCSYIVENEGGLLPRKPAM